MHIIAVARVQPAAGDPRPQIQFLNAWEKIFDILFSSVDCKPILLFLWVRIDCKAMISHLGYIFMSLSHWITSNHSSQEQQRQETINRWKGVATLSVKLRSEPRAKVLLAFLISQPHLTSTVDITLRFSLIVVEKSN